MNDEQDPIRILVVDDEPAIRESYVALLTSRPQSEAERLRVSLFQDSTPSGAGPSSFEVCTAEGAESGLEAVRSAMAAGSPFDLVFLDMRMPPGPDGAWAAERMRAEAPLLDIVIVTAYSDIDPADLASRIPPADRLFYLQKPFHVHEIRQFAGALGGKSRAERDLRRLAYGDPLTGLANRTFLEGRIADALADREPDRSIALFWIDLDAFRRVNDTLGHAAGDRMLREVADRLLGALRDSAPDAVRDTTLARMGADDFLLLVPRSGGRDAAKTLAGNLARAIARPIPLGGHELHPTATIGIALATSETLDGATLLRNADLAMHFAKEEGPEGIAFHETSMDGRALHRLSLDHLLRRALARNELSLHYQPQIDVATGGVAGMEALLRWHCSELGNIPPLEFVPLAEESGSIHALGRWVLGEACCQMREWQSQGLPIARIAVNVSAVQLRDPAFPDAVADALRDSGLPADALELEITETALIDDLESAIDLLANLRTLGVQLAIDDFGVGHSNVQQLKHFRVDRVKIDRSFVIDIEHSERDRTITCGIISIAREMQLCVTAEGVEDEAQLDILTEAGCDELQGYLLSRPLSADAATQYLEALARGRAE